MKKIFFDNFKKNTSGVWYFIPDSFNDYKKKKPCHGFGQIKYDEGSIYTGEIYFDGKNYNKLGYGQQDFTYSSIGEINRFTHQKLYKYVGKFNYRKTDWIYGNGVMYFHDENNKQSCFQTGFFAGLEKIKDFQGEFDYNQLLEGYSKEKQVDFDCRQLLFNDEKNDLKNIKELDNLFIGDSYMEFWHYDIYAEKTFYEAFENSLNVGLGATRFIDWFKYIKQLVDLPKPKNIIINLGFNDIHSNFKARGVYYYQLKCLKMLREIFPDANYYFINLVHAPLFDNYLLEEEKFNKILINGQTKHNYKVIDNYNNIKKEKTNCFYQDLVHLNHYGYNLFEKLIKEELK